MPEQPTTQQTSGPSSIRRRLVVKLVAAVLGLVVALLLGEGLVRVYANAGGEGGRRLAARDPQAILYEPFGRFGYRPTPGKVEKYYNGTRSTFNTMGYRGPLVDTAKPKGVFRIVLLGGSTMAGYGVDDDQTIDAYMRTLMKSRYPNSCVEVVNLALGGYDSYQDYERLRVDGLRLSPDVIVLHTGINDVRNARYPDLGSPPDRRTLIWESVMSQLRAAQATGPSVWSTVKHYSYLARLPGYIREILRQGHELTAIRQDGPYDSAVEYFALNVTRVVNLGLGAGAAVVLSTPPSAIPMRNAPSDPVEKSYWIRDAGTTEAYRRRLADRLREIARAERAGGNQVSYVSHALTLDQFLDDAHLTAGGNAAVARDLVEAIQPFLPPTQVTVPTGNSGCGHP